MTKAFYGMTKCRFMRWFLNGKSQVQNFPLSCRIHNIRERLNDQDEGRCQSLCFIAHVDVSVLRKRGTLVLWPQALMPLVLFRILRRIKAARPFVQVLVLLLLPCAEGVAFDLENLEPNTSQMFGWMLSR
jgi:hypothetical protein